MSVLFATHVYAVNLSGSWIGNGVYSEFGSAEYVARAQVKIVVTQTKNELETCDCWSFEKDGQPMQLCSYHKFDLQGDKVLVKGAQVGTQSANALNLSFKKQTEEVAATALIRPDQKLDFLYSLSGPDRATQASAHGLIRASQNLACPRP